ncbi:MAG TPA: lipocalin family protein [Flavobacteriaceae bacterium]|nr:lipocalin family protein [Flavobacteriaceae bacterium]
MQRIENLINSIKTTFIFAFAIMILTFLPSACSTPEAEKMIPFLNGYWEIEAVKMEDGSIKEFGIASWIDYIEIGNNNGIRKKVSPTLQGGFLVTHDFEEVHVKIEDDSLNLYYTTEFDNWKETVLQADEQRLVILSKDQKKYTYKRFLPINLN